MDFSTRKKMISDQNSWGSPEARIGNRSETLAHKKAWVNTQADADSIRLMIRIQVGIRY
jgi:hypothetical protein